MAEQEQQVIFACRIAYITNAHIITTDAIISNDKVAVYANGEFASWAARSHPDERPHRPAKVDTAISEWQKTMKSRSSILVNTLLYSLITRTPPAWYREGLKSQNTNIVALYHYICHSLSLQRPPLSTKTLAPYSVTRSICDPPSAVVYFEYSRLGVC